MSIKAKFWMKEKGSISRIPELPFSLLEFNLKTVIEFNL